MHYGCGSSAAIATDAAKLLAGFLRSANVALASLPRDDGSVPLSETVSQSVACRLYLLNDPSNPTNPHIMKRW